MGLFKNIFSDDGILENLDLSEGIDLDNGVVTDRTGDFVMSVDCVDCGCRMDRYYDDSCVYFICPRCGERVDYDDIAAGFYPGED